MCISGYINNAKAVPSTSYISEEEQEKMLIEKAAECNTTIRNFRENPLEVACPPIWDGMMCWESSKPGTINVRPCPEYILGFYKHQNATKECMMNGTWYQKFIDIPSYTDFSQCKNNTLTTIIREVDQRIADDYYKPYIPYVKIITDTGYSISIISLLAAFTILISIKRLRCPRNVLHMHLFASFIMRAFVTLLLHIVIKDGLSITDNTHDSGGKEYYYYQEQTTWPCKLMIFLWQYVIMANYMWILMEGLYLHNLIFMALFTDSSSISLYVILGWSLPVLFVLPWTFFKVYLQNLSDVCWTLNDNNYVFLLILGPSLATHIINCVLFIRIVRTLLRKLQCTASEEYKTWRQWAKSTLVLIPLFGGHYMVFTILQFTYSINLTLYLVYIFCDQLFASFNGFIVSLLYCFLNGEVRSELHRKWSNYSFRDSLERWHLYGENSIFCCRFQAKDRQHRPRISSTNSSNITGNSVINSTNRDNKKELLVVTKPLVNSDKEGGLTTNV